MADMAFDVTKKSAATFRPPRLAVNRVIVQLNRAFTTSQSTKFMNSSM
jgi:hypothetical protein